MNIRVATIEDLNAVTAIEQACFPKEEAASKEDIEKRLMSYPNHFWLLEEDGKVVSFVNGMVTDESKLRDEMFEDASLHKEKGMWQMIFSVSTHPDYRKRGYAEMILHQVIQDAKEQGRKGLVLTCKDRLVHYYAKFGFLNEGISESTHGGAVWYDMRLTF